MPDLAARRSILAIHSRHWQPQPPAKLLDDLAQQTGGYCGADLRVGFHAGPVVRALLAFDMKARGAPACASIGSNLQFLSVVQFLRLPTACGQ